MKLCAWWNAGGSLSSPISETSSTTVRCPSPRPSVGFALTAAALAFFLLGLVGLAGGVVDATAAFFPVARSCAGEDGGEG